MAANDELTKAVRELSRQVGEQTGEIRAVRDDQRLLMNVVFRGNGQESLVAQVSQLKTRMNVVEEHHDHASVLSIEDQKSKKTLLAALVSGMLALAASVFSLFKDKL